MAPLVLFGTLLTHLFGGSAGREGTAVQMGASLADTLARRFGAGSELRAAMLVAGMAGGFGSVFGTPLAGAVFGAEVVIRTNLPGSSEEHVLPGVVRWTRPDGMGVQFGLLGARETHLITEILRKHEEASGG